MTSHLHLAGSSVDRKPLLQCWLCLRKRERAGGLEQGLRFICRECVAKRTARCERMYPAAP